MAFKAEDSNIKKLKKVKSVKKKINERNAFVGNKINKLLN